MCCVCCTKVATYLPNSGIEACPRAVTGGNRIRRQVEGYNRLVDLIRNEVNLAGTHVGCDSSQCGFCTLGVTMALEGILKATPSSSGT